MDTKSLAEQLAHMHTHIAETYGQPFIEPTLKLVPNGTWRINLYREIRPDSEGGYDLGKVRGNTPEGTVKAAWDFLRSLPEPGVQKQREWQKKLGVVIDEGQDLQLPNEVLDPLRAGSQAMTKNLLEKGPA